jgi:hypothetical protein
MTPNPAARSEDGEVPGPEIRGLSEGRGVGEYARALLTVYQIERGDQLNSGNQSRTLVGTGLAYAAAVAALLSKASPHTSALLLLAAPLPLIALISLLIAGIGNVQQRARYLIALEEELEPYLTPPGRNRLVVPDGFRRPEQVLLRPTIFPNFAGTPPGAGRFRSWTVAFVGAIPHTVMLLAECGLIYYAVHLTHGWRSVAGYLIYGVLAAAQGLSLIYALRRPAPRVACSGSDGDASDSGSATPRDAETPG